MMEAAQMIDIIVQNGGGCVDGGGYGDGEVGGKDLDYWVKWWRLRRW